MKINKNVRYGTRNKKAREPEGTSKEPMQRRDSSLKMFCLCERKLITVTKQDIWDGRIPRCENCSPVNITPKE